jgi:predicted choloylglycine hydrolase
MAKKRFIHKRRRIISVFKYSLINTEPVTLAHAKHESKMLNEKNQLVNDYSKTKKDLTAWLNSKRRDFQVPGENLEGCLLA